MIDEWPSLVFRTESTRGKIGNNATLLIFAAGLATLMVGVAALAIV